MAAKFRLIKLITYKIYMYLRDNSITSGKCLTKSTTNIFSAYINT